MIAVQVTAITCGLESSGIFSGEGGQQKASRKLVKRCGLGQRRTEGFEKKLQLNVLVSSGVEVDLRGALQEL